MTPTSTPDAPTVITRPKVRSPLLPYQARFNADEVPLKIWEKSRRIGATFGVAADVSISRLSKRRNEDCWFSSADESAAGEFIEYVDYWTRVFEGTAEIFTEPIDDGETKVNSYVARFPSGKRVTAMTSNPRRFRSKGGDVILDEFAYHDRPREMLAAASPCTTWGGRMTILSTHNGEQSLYAQLIDMGRRHAAGTARAGDMPFSVHRTTIEDAVREGIVEKINETRGTNYTREAFLESCRQKCATEDDWLQEYMCEPSAESSAYLTYEMINACISRLAAPRREDLAEFLDDIRARAAGASAMYAGADIGRKHDRFVLPVIAKFGSRYETAGLLSWQNRRFAEMKQAIDEVMKISVDHGKTRVRRLCIDATGMGMQLGEHAEETYRHRAEAITFTQGVKEDLATTTRVRFEDRTIGIPDDVLLKDDLHSIRKTTTSAGKVRFEGERNADGHADHFWGLALALHAAASKQSQFMPVAVTGGSL